MGDVIGRLGCRSAVGGRDDEDTANGGPGKKSTRRFHELKHPKCNETQRTDFEHIFDR
jgi:hypothetical protein